jgi:4,5-DOPA dioxygenase extradiol
MRFATTERILRGAMTDLAATLSDLPATPRMPALFVGPGNPMNAIVDNDFSRSWRQLGESLPVPRAILCVSAHWMTRGTTFVHVKDHPRTIHDFGGFPAQLYAQQYPAPGSTDVAAATIKLVQASHIEPDNDWGLDHGAWSVLIRMFPKADVPVFQLSLDLAKSPHGQFELARELKPLRERGVLIVGSGNLVHNLHAIAPGVKPYDWAEDFDARMTAALERRDFQSVVDTASLGRLMQLAHPTPEHFLPILFPLGVTDAKDELNFFNAGFDLASISMRSFVLS